MTRLPPVLRLLAALCLSAACGPSLATPPDATDELLAPLTAAYLGAVKPGEQAALYSELFGPVMRRVQRSYAREVDLPGLVTLARQVVEKLEPQSGDPVDVFSKAVNAALASLDPHSRYLDPRAQKNFRSSVSGSFGGLGLQVAMADGLIRVVAAMPGTPAARAGLRSGDLIVQFDDQAVQGMTLAAAISQMRGAPGTSIALLVRRPGQADDFTVSLVRETIRTQPVRWSMEGDVLVLHLTSFTSAVSAQIQKAIADATTTSTPRGIILDMRGNPGGVFRQAVLTADTFLATGKIVSMVDRNTGNRRSWQADVNEHLPGVPMVVLIDTRSASASEVVAAALQDNGRATVMGQRSFGKGSIQTIIPLGEDKGALRLTTSLYQAPSGRTVQRTGVAPDIELVSASESPAPGARREADRANALPGSDEPSPPKARVAQERCAARHKATDPVLACALAFVEAGTVETFLAALEAEPLR